MGSNLGLANPLGVRDPEHTLKLAEDIEPFLRSTDQRTKSAASEFLAMFRAVDKLGDGNQDFFPINVEKRAADYGPPDFIIENNREKIGIEITFADPQRLRQVEASAPDSSLIVMGSPLYSAGRAHRTDQEFVLRLEEDGNSLPQGIQDDEWAGNQPEMETIKWIVNAVQRKQKGLDRWPRDLMAKYLVVIWTADPVGCWRDLRSNNELWGLLCQRSWKVGCGFSAIFVDPAKGPQEFVELDRT